MTINAELEKLAERVRKYSETISTEEAAKTSIVLPFLQALGYEVFDPSEVVPEFTADAVGKKGEKVDYAIQLGGEIRILIECKGLSTKLETRHLSQLFRYFTVTSAKFGILTNGRIFEFYTDLDEANKLDKRPFFVFDLLDTNNAAISELKKFEKASFDVDRILANAERLKYVSAVKKFLSLQFEEPSPDFVKLVAADVYDGRVTAQVREVIGSCIVYAHKEMVREAVQARLSTALQNNGDREEDDIVQSSDAENFIETTQEEIEGMLTIRAIVRDVLSASRVGLRDAKSYCAVIVDDNNRKPLARLHFNRKQWYLGLFDRDSEERVPIDGLDAIYDFSERLRVTAQKYVENRLEG